MSGVISPTNLSLFSSPVTVTSPMRPVTSRHSSSLPRWTPPTSVNNTGPTGPFISLDEDYMMTPLISGNSNETNTALIDDGEFCFPTDPAEEVSTEGLSTVLVLSSGNKSRVFQLKKVPFYFPY